MHMEISSRLVTQPVSDHNNVFFFSNEESFDDQRSLDDQSNNSEGSTGNGRNIQKKGSSAKSQEPRA